MNSEFQKQAHRRAQYLMLITVVLLFGMAGVVAACFALDRQLERQAKIDRERVQW